MNLDTPQADRAMTRHALSAWGVLIVVMGVTLLAWYLNRMQVNADAEQRFSQRVEDISTAIAERFEGYEQVMRGGVGLFSAGTNHIDRGGWQRYYASLRLEQHFPGIQGLGYSLVVRPSEREAHIRSIRGEGFPEYTINPPGPRDLYTSIIYLEPFAGRNLRAFGYDMYSEPMRRAAMQHARDHATTAISGKVTLVQETGKDVQSGFLMYLPVYAAGAGTDSPAARQAALRGYVYSVFRVNDLMKGIFGKDSLDVSFNLFDGAESAQAQLYDHDAAHANPRHATPLLKGGKTIELYGRQWVLRVASGKKFEAAINHRASTAILVGGLIFSMLLFVFIRTLAASRNRAVVLADGMTRELRYSENRIRAVLDNVVDGIITISDRGLIESINPAGERIFGYLEAELTGKNVSVLMPDPYHAAHDGYLRNYLGSGEKKIIGIGREVMGRRKDGSVFPLDLAVSEVPLDGRRGFTGIVRDITARKEAETQLRETTSLQHAILNSANYSIISTDGQGIIRTINRAAERMLGYAATDVVGKLTPAVFHDAVEVERRARALSAEFDQAIEPGFEVFVAKARRGVPDENEWTYIRNDGSRFPVLLSVTALHDEQGDVTGFLGIGYDITERKEMDRVKSEFISTVSHELRTPLTSIMGSLGLIASGVGGSLPAQATSLLDIAHKNAARLVRLINDILDIDKIESGKMRFDLRVQELMPLVVQAVEANRDYARQFDVKFALVRETPDAFVDVDGDRFAQVLANLLSNAAKFSPSGSAVEIAVDRVGNQVRIAVTDHGPGISPEFQAKIFQKFCQADSSDHRQKGGTGLGLSITRAIVENLGGRIDFTTDKGTGTTFFVDLPDASAMPLVAAVVDAVPAVDGAHVLICEDDPDVARLLQLMLKEAGYRADISHTAEQAREMLRQHAYAALTVDIALPGQNGIDLIRELRADASFNALPIVVVSANAERGKQSLSGGIMIVDWLDKPIDQPRLLTALRRAIAPDLARPRILHVEDDGDIQHIVGTLLQHCEVDCARTLAAAKRALQENRYDLLILDMMLPDGSGSELLPVIQALKNPTPVLVFSANESQLEVMPGIIAAALVKSQTTNDKLLQTICRLMPPRTVANDPVVAIRA